ncbi:MAG TPA: HAMP domain-containing protein, partial [Gammaproteobacteria bacterium]|nr:HAMP domain-containing protein [Gammaproteobacteria bacterium]
MGYLTETVHYSGYFHSAYGTGVQAKGSAPTNRSSIRMMNTLKNITLKTKLRFLLVVLLGLMWTAVGIGINKMQLIGSEMTAITDNDIPLTEVITQVTTNQLEQAVHFERIVRLGEEIANRHGADGAFKQEINQFNALSNKIDEAIKRGESVAQKAIANTGIQATATEFTRVTSLLKDIEAQHALYEKHAHDVFNSFGISGLENTLHLMEKVDAQEKAIDQKLEELLTQIEKFTEKASLKAQQDEHTALQLLIALGIAATVIGLAISLPIISVINRGITRAMEAANYVANGDLSKEIKSDSTDEIGQLL